MKLLSRKIKAATAADRWAYRYQANRWPDKQATLQALCDLGPDPDPDEVDRVIGNASWTRTSCSECGNEDPMFVVQLGHEPDYESCTAWICDTCIEKAYFMSRKALTF